ncbi:MAG: peptidase M48, partial [Deltaproteobacteria bacterium HGW-Deltaproteobacteria-7]
MEKLLLVLFLVLFIGRMALRYLLQHLNTKSLKAHGRTVPPVFEGSIDEATLSRMADYTCEQSRLSAREDLSGDAIELGVLFLLLPLLVGWLSVMNIHIIGQALIFFAALAVISGMASLPFDLYHTFVLEQKYGFSTITWKLWLIDFCKSIIISGILLTIMVSAMIALITFLPESWWFWGWAFFTLFQLVLLWLYPVLIAPLFNKFEPIRDEALKDKIMSLIAKAGFQAKGIYQVDEGKRSKHTNAYFTGIGKTKRIVLYDTLLSSHTHEEILSVLAHEIGHWKKKHILKQLAFMITASLILFYFVYRITIWPPLFWAFGITQTPVYAGIFLASLYLSASGFFLSPLG